MKILLFIDSLGSGGAQRQMVGLAKLLQDRGYQIKVIYYHPIYFYSPYLDEHHVPNEYVEGAESKLKRIYLIARAIRQFQPEVVISYLDTPNIIACLLKVIGMRFRLIVSERNTSQKLSCFEKAKFFLLRHAEVIVANSFTQERFIKDNFPHLVQRTKVITNFVDTHLFVPSDREEHDRLRILIVGRISRQKNTLALLQAVHIVKGRGLPFSVDWYGRPDDDVFTQCQTYMNNHQLNDVFSFHEPTSDILHEYQQSDIFCLPSLYEGFPNVVCEAMSCGLPILCSNVCDHALLVEDGKNGFLFDPHDVMDMVDKMVSILMLSEARRQEMGLWSREKAEDMFSKDSFVEKYIHLLSCRC